MEKAAPLRPIPKPNAQMARKIVAQVNRQKFAANPPSIFAERWPQIAEIENRIVVSSAGITRERYESGRPLQAETVLNEMQR